MTHTGPIRRAVATAGPLTYSEVLRNPSPGRSGRIGWGTHMCREVEQGAKADLEDHLTRTMGPGWLVWNNHGHAVNWYWRKLHA